MAAITPVFADMLHNAMPVINRIHGPEQQGMATPADNRELVSRMLAPVLGELTSVPPIHALLEMMGEGLIRYADELARQAGRLMADASPPVGPQSARASSPAPQDTPAPEAGRE